MFMNLFEKRALVAAGRGSELPPQEGPRFHTTGGHSHQIAANVVQLANSGKTLIEALEICAEKDSNCISHRPGEVLKFIRGLDDEASAEIERANFLCGPTNI